jgi:hypothetical protein
MEGRKKGGAPAATDPFLMARRRGRGGSDLVRGMPRGGEKGRGPVRL